MAQTFKNTVSFLRRIQCSSKVTGKIILQKSSGNHHQSGVLDDFFKIIFIKAFFTYTYKIEIKKEKKNTHTYIVQVEEYQAKHTHKAISVIQILSM